MESGAAETVSLRVVPATEEHWDDIAAFFSNVACHCQYWRMTSSEYGRFAAGDQQRDFSARAGALRQQVAGEYPPGMLAYLNGQMVGWLGMWPRSLLRRLGRSRTIPAPDDRPVWSIVCFLVRVGYRRKGVARALLRGAIETARAYGAPAIEAYPVDPQGKRVDVSFAYVGLMPLFEREGFQRVVETQARSAGLPRWLVRLELTAKGGIA